MSEKTERGLVTELVAKGTTLQHAADYVWQLFARSEVGGKSWAEEAEVAMAALSDAMRDHASALARATPEAVRKADAAPALYEALEDLLSAGAMDNAAAYDRAVKSARLAIAKAEGRS